MATGLQAPAKHPGADAAALDGERTQTQLARHPSRLDKTIRMMVTLDDWKAR